MAPIVDGLKSQYADRVDFRSLNAGQGEGLAAFEALRLAGHPAYVILQPDGSIPWRQVGQLPGQVLEQQLQQALAGP